MSGKPKSELRVCLIGNSHSGCFKTGWDAISNYYDNIEISFYPHHGEFYNSFQVDEKTKTLGMTDEFVRLNFEKLSGNGGIIDFRNFDLCIVVGGISLSSYFTNNFYSKQVIKQIAKDHFESSHINVLFSKIRLISDIEVLLVPAPNSVSRKKVDNHLEPGRDIIHTLINRSILKPKNAMLALPPSEVWESNNVHFKQKYAAGERLTGASLVPGNKKEIIDDLVHMNAAYGALFLKRIFADMGEKAKKGMVMPVADGDIPFSERVFGKGK